MKSEREGGCFFVTGWGAAGKRAGVQEGLPVVEIEVGSREKERKDIRNTGGHKGRGIWCSSRPDRRDLQTAQEPRDLIGSKHRWQSE